MEILELDPDLKEDIGNGEEKFAHYAEAASVTEGYIMGTPVMALCGEVFIPTRDPEKLRVCPICKEVMDALFLSE